MKNSIILHGGSSREDIVYRELKNYGYFCYAGMKTTKLPGVTGVLSNG